MTIKAAQLFLAVASLTAMFKNNNLYSGDR